MSSIFLINRVFYNSDAGYDDNTVLGYVTSEEVARAKVNVLNKLHEEVKKLLKKGSQQIKLTKNYLKTICLPPDFPCQIS